MSSFDKLRMKVAGRTMTNSSQPVRLLPIFTCIALMLIYPFFSVPIQHATAGLAPRVGEIQARILTEGAIWLYGALVVGIALLGERRTLASIGLVRPTFATLFWGVAAAVTLLAMGAAVSYVTYSALKEPNRSVAEIEALVRGSLVYALFIALRGGVIEEVFYRGLAIEQLTVLTGRRWFAAVAATLVFIVIHALRFDLRQLITIAVPSIGFTALYLWRRNLLVNIIAHFLIDAIALGAVALKATSLY
jgi:membrane protease YdiL (CAAX protease family)